MKQTAQVVLMLVLARAAFPTTHAALVVQAAQPPASSNQPSISPVASSSKQNLLASQAEQLVALATELKDQVDKTNKNILSIKVVHKAEEIERFAHQMKERNKKPEPR